MAQPVASLSLDLDNKWSYLKTHGDAGWEALPSYLDVVVPRYLDLLDKLSLRTTVFIVGQDAALAKNHQALRSLAEADHEIGNHSFHHEPWLHLYSPEQLEQELDDAEDAIESATGVRPTGFRGPGFSFSPTLLASLMRRQYRFDASTFPTFVGPLARTYYFFTSRLSDAERDRRKQLFGTWREGFRPVRPYLWQLQHPDENTEPTPPAPTESYSIAEGARQLLEIPVTTMPITRMPIHVSYLLFLRQKSRLAAMSYWRSALAACRMFGIGPSLLLHPLDFLGADDDADLTFFPAMGMDAHSKLTFVEEVLRVFTECYTVGSLGEHAAVLGRSPSLRKVLIDAAPQAVGAPIGSVG